MNILSLCEGGDGEGEVGEGAEGGEEGFGLGHFFLRLTWQVTKVKSDNEKIRKWKWN